MFKFLSILFIILLSACCKDHAEECPCYKDHQAPQYKGCEPGTIYDIDSNCSDSELLHQLASVVKYPHEALIDSVQGTVLVRFDIYEDGSIGNFTVVNDTLGHGLANAAIEAVMTLNKKGFCPARENCSPVVFTYTLPVKFVLQ